MLVISEKQLRYQK